MESKKSFLIIPLGFAVLVSCFQPSNCCCSNKPGGFKGMFVFGSSVVDNGNNNHLINPIVKSNYMPYGVDFPWGPTGRFSNGKNIADFVGDHLGLPFIPAFWDPTTRGYRVVRGVNYGSGGSGILDATGSQLGGVMSMNEQIREFKNVTLPELEAVLIRADREEILSKYLFMVAAGNNDYGLNYFVGQTPNVTPEAFTQMLISNYSEQLKSLYNVGARRFLLVSVYPLGCNPWIREYTNTTNGCHQPSNLITRLFYARLLALVDQLESDLPGSEFLVLNSHTLITDIINDPLPKGFENVSGAWCELKVAVGNVKLGCKEGGSVCPNRNSYVFFDGQHNTQALNAIIAAKAYSSPNKSEIYPFNLCQLAHSV